MNSFCVQLWLGIKYFRFGLDFGLTEIFFLMFVLVFELTLNRIFKFESVITRSAQNSSQTQTTSKEQDRIDSGYK